MACVAHALVTQRLVHLHAVLSVCVIMCMHGCLGLAIVVTLHSISAMSSCAGTGFTGPSETKYNFAHRTCCIICADAWQLVTFHCLENMHHV